MNDEYYMRRALALAEKAGAAGEVPIGALVVWQDESGYERIVGEGFNRRESGKNALYHAEILAIDAACGALGGWRLHKGVLYVTVEPCIMCAGAIVNARIRRVVYGAADPRFGAFGSLFDANRLGLNHRPEVTGGLFSAEAEALMADFFRRLRDK